ncbi:MAG: hypothetical protein V1914_03555 [archaeon]
MIPLGSKIELEGFENIEPAQQVVVRKMVGTLAKKLEEAKGAYDKLTLTKTGTTISIKATYTDNTLEGVAEHDNLFFALNNAFQQLTP